MRHVSIDYEITTPANTLLTAESGSGDLQLSNLNGTVQGHTGSGSIRADKLGAGSKLDTGSGSIEATNLMGSTMLQTGSGEVSAELGSAGDVVASTGSGSIKLTNVQGAIKADTGSGSLEISGQPTSPWKLETGSGDITLQVGSNARFTLDAETGSGSVKRIFPSPCVAPWTSTTSPEPSTEAAPRSRRKPAQVTSRSSSELAASCPGRSRCACCAPGFCWVPAASTIGRPAAAPGPMV